MSRIIPNVQQPRTFTRFTCDECQLTLEPSRDRTTRIVHLSFQYEKLARLLKDFEPYRVLWSTASDWLRLYDSWMNDPIISVNAEDIEKVVTEM